MRNRLRLISGLILFTFVVGHFINHSFGLISVTAMEIGTVYFIKPWRTLPGTIILVGAFCVHAGNALYALWIRRSLKLPLWEALQMVLGFLAPLLLAAHVAATRVLVESTEFYDSSYALTLATFWHFAPWKGVVQAIAVVVVWTHACIGLHFWLRLKPWYGRVRGLAYGLAVALPTLALAGYVAGGGEVRVMVGMADWLETQRLIANFEPWMPAFIVSTEFKIQTTILALIASVLVGRSVRTWLRRRAGVPRLFYAPGSRVADLQPGATLLESIRDAGIPHASLCGGRGRCSTCRVRVGRGLDDLPPPDESEHRVLARITDSPSVRLACQIRPTADIEVARLLPADATPVDASAGPAYGQGRELNVAFLFVDLRGSTKLCEARLPFDVVFVLNQFFAELSLALEETNGHYAQFNGDGLMAIYGLESGTAQGCADSIAGAKAMLRRIGELNERLGDELAEPLKIGVGIHAGEAIVGSMGPPATPIVSGLGDNVNIAARLEAQTKEFGVPLVVSVDVAEHSGLDLSGFARHTIPIRGRDNPLDIIAVDAPEAIATAPAPGAPSEAARAAQIPA